MRTSIFFAAALFCLTATSVVAADSPNSHGESDSEALRPKNGNVSTYKLRVAGNYPAGSSEGDGYGYSQPETYSPTPYSSYSDDSGDAEREERERLEREREESERAERERVEQERIERERLELEERERELERIRLAEEAERERLERLRLERERAEKERVEQERRERVERDRLEREQAERERIERERLERERLEQERADRERAVRDFSGRLRVGDADSEQDILIVNHDATTSDNPPLETIDEFPTARFDSVQDKARTKVLATLNGKSITEEDVAREMWLRRGRETFDWLIGREILRQELERLELRVSDSEIREALDKHLQVLRKAYPKLRKRDDLTRAASGMTLDEYRERTVWTELALRKIMRASLETREEDLRRYYASVRAEYIRPERVRISQIFIPPQTGPNSDGIVDAEAWTRAERQIREAYELLRRQEFVDVAKLYGAGNQMSRWVKRGDLLRELEGPAFAIRPDSFTPPIKSSMGWHMLMVEESEERREPSLDEVRGEVLARYEEERFMRLGGEFMARLKEKAVGDGALVIGEVGEVLTEPGTQSNL